MSIGFQSGFHVLVHILMYRKLQTMLSQLFCRKSYKLGSLHLLNIAKQLFNVSILIESCHQAYSLRIELCLKIAPNVIRAHLWIAASMYISLRIRYMLASDILLGRCCIGLGKLLQTDIRASVLFDAKHITSKPHMRQIITYISNV